MTTAPVAPASASTASPVETPAGSASSAAARTARSASSSRPEKVATSPSGPKRSRVPPYCCSDRAGSLEQRLQRGQQKLGIVQRGRSRGENRDHAALPRRRRKLGRRLLRDFERGIVAQDRALEPLQLGRGVEPELVREREPRRAVDLERLGVAPRAVEREHQLAAQPLPERVRRDERLELGHEVVVPAEAELAGEPLLLGVEPKPLEPGDLGAGKGLEGEVVERRPAPERERVGEQRAARAGRSGARLLEEPLEAQARRPLSGSSASRYPGGSVRSASRPDRLAQRVDGVLQRAERGARRVGAPEILDQAVGRDDLAGMKREHREKRALLAARQGHD